MTGQNTPVDEAVRNWLEAKNQWDANFRTWVVQTKGIQQIVSDEQMLMLKSEYELTNLDTKAELDRLRTEWEISHAELMRREIEARERTAETAFSMTPAGHQTD